MQRIPDIPHLSVHAAHAKLFTVYVFTGALLAQTSHISEHVVQLYQHAVLGLSISQSHGLVYFFRFLSGTIPSLTQRTFSLSGGSFFQCKFYRIHGSSGKIELASISFTAGFLIQGYHVIEHSGRIVQLYQTGCTPCPGILGRFFDGVYLHFLFNALVYILPLLAFIAYGFHLRLKYPFTGDAQLSP